MNPNNDPGSTYADNDNTKYEDPGFMADTISQIMNDVDATAEDKIALIEDYLSESPTIPSIPENNTLD